MLEDEKKKNTARAKLDGQALIAVFDESEPPLAWQFDLEKNHTFTVMLRRNETGWDLGVNVLREPFAPVARFSNSLAAEDALKAVQDALYGSSGDKLLNGNLLRWGAGLLVAFVALSFLFNFMTSGPSAPELHARRLFAEPQTSVPLQVKTPEPTLGVPQDADGILKPPEWQTPDAGAK